MDKVKTKTKFVCTECGAFTVKWQGRCSECGAWNTLCEEPEISRSREDVYGFASSSVSKLSEVISDAQERMLTKIGEFDRCIGAGLVRGSLVLIGGVPGIGKSTLILQISELISRGYGKVIYVSGEESLSQIKLRADRLGVKSEELLLLSEVNLEIIVQKVKEINPCLIVIDSVQTLFDSRVQSVPGSVSQVRQSVLELMKLAKTLNITVMLVGHVTKEGFIAGPKVLEHMVDAVLYFEGENIQDLRMLRCIKNRFGATNEVGVFRMSGTGLSEITEVSKFLISQRVEHSPGSIIVPVIEGTRSFLIELQALTTRTNFGLPARKTAGVDLNRLSLIIAVLEKKASLSLSSSDIFINVVNGVYVNETAVDLAVAIAVFSSVKNKVIPESLVAFGELGLLGEVRSTSFAESRVKEAVKMGFKKCILPKANITGELAKYPMEFMGVENLQEALKIIQQNG
ncbi:MAG: DNA repair protein RadA [Armatimonadota bacterium]